jgi:Luciferase-like monooxygenase
MRFSICVMADVDEIDFFSHAESLGYDAVWVTDSQMLFSDCYAVLALAARQTSRLRLGPGVAIRGTRIPPVRVAPWRRSIVLRRGASFWPSEPATPRRAPWDGRACASPTTRDTCASCFEAHINCLTISCAGG